MLLAGLGEFTGATGKDSPSANSESCKAIAVARSPGDSSAWRTVFILGGGKNLPQSTRKSTDLQSIREIADRLDGKAVQAIDYGEVSVEQLTDAQLYAIAAGGRTEDELEMKVIPPMPPKD